MTSQKTAAKETSISPVLLFLAEIRDSTGSLANALLHLIRPKSVIPKETKTLYEKARSRQTFSL